MSVLSIEKTEGNIHTSLRRALVASVFMLTVLGTGSTLAQEPKGHGDVVSGIMFNDSFATVSSKLGDQCSISQTMVLSPPSLPFAANSEQFLICQNLNLHDAAIEKAAFRFADDKLVLVDLSGGAKAIFEPRLESDAMMVPFIPWQVHFPELTFLGLESDFVRLVGQDYAQSIVLWSPSILNSETGLALAEGSAAIPDIIKFGESIDVLGPQFEEQCFNTAVREIEDIWLQTNPNKQVQINCYGFGYAGFNRKIEAVFGDGQLELVWIAGQKPEEDRVRAALIKVYGQPTFVNENWEAFDGWKIALRKDVPEVLMLSDRLVPIYRELHEGTK